MCMTFLPTVTALGQGPMRFDFLPSALPHSSRFNFLSCIPVTNRLIFFPSTLFCNCKIESLLPSRPSFYSSLANILRRALLRFGAAIEQQPFFIWRIKNWDLAAAYQDLTKVLATLQINKTLFFPVSNFPWILHAPSCKEMHMAMYLAI